MRGVDWEMISETATEWKSKIPLLQVIVFTMCGGGKAGRIAAEQPADFNVITVSDSPYSWQDIQHAVTFLKVVAVANGKNPRNLRMPDFPNMGLFAEDRRAHKKKRSTDAVHVPARRKSKV